MCSMNNQSDMERKANMFRNLLSPLAKNRVGADYERALHWQSIRELETGRTEISIITFQLDIKPDAANVLPLMTTLTLNSVVTLAVIATVAANR